MPREPVEIALYSGTFESQPLVFAHLFHAAPGIDLDHVEVICRQDPTARLLHYLDPAQVTDVLEAMGLHTTIVLIFAQAGTFTGSDLLDPLTSLTGSRVVL